LKRNRKREDLAAALKPSSASFLRTAGNCPSLSAASAGGDLLGVELGGALKNPYAIGAGLCDGLKLGDNAKAAYLTRSLHEMVRAGVALGGQPETFYGLSGFGDLVATSTGAWSRNRTFGEALAKGTPIDELLGHRKTVVEGYAVTEGFHALLKKHGAETPILAHLYAILYEGLQPRKALESLLARAPKPEHH